MYLGKDLLIECFFFLLHGLAAAEQRLALVLLLRIDRIEARGCLANRFTYYVAS